MTTKTFTLTLTDEVAGSTVTPTSAPDVNRQILADRTRTIDQLKRLYAVVMGFAVTSCFANMYICIKPISIISLHAFVLIAQGTSFLTLIVLFYLGAERLFDVRYLRNDSAVPSRLGLLTDLVTCGVTALWFVIIADTFPDPKLIEKPDTIESHISSSFRTFTFNLFALYAIDAVLLAAQLARVSKLEIGDYRKTIKHHQIWLTINILFLVLFFPSLTYVLPQSAADTLTHFVPNFLIGIFNSDARLASYVIVWHVVRFGLDYGFTFDSYYPNKNFE